jgi:hypothetical protein
MTANHEASQAKDPQTRFEKGARLVCLVMALIGVIVTAVPILFQLEPYYVPLILVGSGIAVIALAVFLYFSI